MFLHEVQVVLISAPTPAVPVYGERLAAFSGAITHFARQIDVSGCQDALVYVLANGSFAAKDIVGLGSANVMDGLLLLYQWGNYFIQPLKIGFSKGNSFPAEG